MRKSLRNKPDMGKPEPAGRLRDVPVLRLGADREGVTHAMSNSITYHGARCENDYAIRMRPLADVEYITCLTCAALTY